MWSSIENEICSLHQTAAAFLVLGAVFVYFKIFWRERNSSLNHNLVRKQICLCPVYPVAQQVSLRSSYEFETGCPVLYTVHQEGVCDHDLDVCANGLMFVTYVRVVNDLPSSLIVRIEEPYRLIISGCPLWEGG